MTSLPMTLRPRRLPTAAAHVLTPMILSFFMSGVVSLIATLRATGLTADLPVQALHAWMLSYPVAFPAALVMLPIVRRIVGLLVEPPPAG
ncbi:DUF2798 domain-containing protein [Rhizobium sp. CC-YZS058]|uniref:DUF2798 domain-containing protein n=1 Tax=Rhizobium sp. CC-YZS058 TaxID=3042153 RepID=UPI002B052FB1|nr:DUF2798 domain-containing protein [Rhizobium sp. CC-YZS058]MEA3534141.1 DUF2798 domain-containing protein [Rhizobium sp. CC-YZS058]